MKKKGFTLVELLAVIAILAILVIIALPNVIGLFQSARKNSFGNEIREIYKQAQTQWTLDSYDISTEGAGKKYGATNSGDVPTNCLKKLDMGGRQNINYVIELDKNGNVIKIQATDGTYYYTKTGTDIKITDIKNDDINDVESTKPTYTCS